MVRSKTLSNTVLLALVLFVCQTAQSLKTGCKYPSKVSVEKDVLHFDLKCAYLFSGLTHVLITKQLALFFSPSVLIGEIIRYDYVIKRQIYSLYHLKATRMGALWLIHSYLGLFHSLQLHKSARNKNEDGQKIIDTLDYVIAQVRTDLTHCRKDNSFNDERTIFSNGNLSKNDWETFLYKNNAKARNLLKANNICDETFDEVVGKTLQIGSLLLNKIGSKDSIDSIKDLMNVFNVQVDWKSTGELLRKSWSDARINFWTSDKFVSLKLYYTQTFNFLKIIMLRLTVRHLHYLQPYCGTGIYVHYAKEWYNKVQRFGELLSLSEDLHVKNLLFSLDNLIKQEENIANVINYLFVILNELCLPLGCVATKPFERTDKVFDTLGLEKNTVPIERYSLENATAFLHYLSCMFSHVDLKLVRLFREYIDEVAGSSSIDELANRLHNTFDFDYIN